jgi:hypothetical protein
VSDLYIVLDPKYRSDMEDAFFKTLYRFIHEQNHSHKFNGYEYVCDMLNESAKELKIDIDFVFKEDFEVLDGINDLVCPECNRKAADAKLNGEFYEVFCLKCNTLIEKRNKFRWSITGTDNVVTNSLPSVFEEFKGRYRFQR